MQVPILYHKQLFKLLGLLLKNLEYCSTAIKVKIRDTINLDSLFRILALPDIYSHRGAAAELYFLLKKDALHLLNIFLEKADSLLKLYESEALGALLDHYIVIFLAGREKQSLPCDNEMQFATLLDDFAGEIKYNLSNLRDYYTSQVQPFLSRLLHLFERYGKKDSSRNYARLLQLT